MRITRQSKDFLKYLGSRFVKKNKDRFGAAMENQQLILSCQYLVRRVKNQEKGTIQQKSKENEY